MSKNGFYIKSSDYFGLKDAVKILTWDASKNTLFFKIIEDKKMSAWKWFSKLNHRYEEQRNQEVGVLNKSFLTLFLVVDNCIVEKFVIRGLQLTEHFCDLISESYEPMNHQLTIHYDEIEVAPILMAGPNVELHLFNTESDQEVPDNLISDEEWKSVSELDIPGDPSKVLEFQ